MPLQVFGSEPPAALFRITRFAASDDALLSPAPKRTSLLTCASGIHDPASPTSAGERERRASFLTTASASSYGHTHTSVLTVVSLAAPDSKAARRHSSVHISPSLPPRSDSLASSTRALLPSVDDEPPSPPPFTDVAVSAAEHRRAQSALAVFPPSPPPPTPALAWARRRRAQKLTRFFGVDVREIEPALEAATPPGERAGTPAFEECWDEEGVDVRVVGPAAGKRWRLGHERTKTEVDPRAALRGLKA